MSFLILTLTVKFHPPVFVDVVLFPFIFWCLWLQGVDAAERNFTFWRTQEEEEEEEEEGAGYWFLFVSDHLFLGNIQSSPHSRCSH